MPKFDQEYWDTLERRRVDPDYEPPAKPRKAPEPENTSWTTIAVYALAVLGALVILMWIGNWHA